MRPRSKAEQTAAELAGTGWPIPAVTSLMTFLDARWDEDRCDAGLFHELDCPDPQQAKGDCHCPCPAEIFDRVAFHRRIVSDCVRRIRREQAQGLCWPVDSVLAFQTMKAFALPYEVHPDWQDTWYP